MVATPRKRGGSVWYVLKNEFGLATLRKAKIVNSNMKQRLFQEKGWISTFLAWTGGKKITDIWYKVNIGANESSEGDQKFTWDSAEKERLDCGACTKIRFLNSVCLYNDTFLRNASFWLKMWQKMLFEAVKKDNIVFEA